MPFSKRKDYSPLSAEGYFDSALEVEIDSPPGSTASSSPASSKTIFRVYYSPLSSPNPNSTPNVPSAPVPSPAPATAPWLPRPTLLPRPSPNGIIFVCLHGAGHSALSFALLAREIAARTPQGTKVGVLAYDARGHGKTRTEGGKERGLSLDGMAEDLVGLLKVIWGRMEGGRADRPGVVLVGHSMVRQLGGDGRAARLSIKMRLADGFWWDG